MKKIILVGGGGHCHSVIDAIEATAEYQIIGIIDNDLTLSSVMSYPILGKDSDLESLKDDRIYFLITLGKIAGNKRRIDLFNYLLNNGFNIATIISPLAYVSAHAKIGIGTVVMHHAVVNSNVSIGQNCIINTKSLIEHDAKIGDSTHVSTGAIINGGCLIGDDVFIGSQSTVNLNVEISDSVSIASNSLVSKSIVKKGIFRGIPVVQ